MKDSMENSITQNPHSESAQSHSRSLDLSRRIGNIHQVKRIEQESDYQ